MQRRRTRWQYRHLIFIAIPVVSTRATLLGEQSAGLRAMFVMKVPDKFFV
jgi:hypothetical protein